MWRRLAQTALEEDVGFGDLTTDATVPPGQTGSLALVAREPLVVAGLPVVPAVYEALDPAVRVDLLVADGTRLGRGDVLARVRGPARALLTGERVTLNVLQWLSGIATATRAVVDAVAEWDVDVLDTRKTRPGWRAFEKYAVRVGGGKNHRFGLDHAVLIKDNHIAAAGGVAEAIRRARRAAGPTVFVEVEVDNLEQLEEALTAGPDGVLLDNMDPATLQEAVRRAQGRVWTEASGGIRPESVRDVARTGVNAISLGWLTHSAPAVDIGADWEAP
ncbi:MAG: carboxylating nicotinate-nucleotide diphosphorylase [Actinomycetia bacterium]|nr:carboxylating nicotinate-nucleotide diphosphorylase [Actinomycetes bacterium]